MAVAPTSESIGCTQADDIDLFKVTLPPGNGGYLVHFAVTGIGAIKPKMDVLDGSRKRLVPAYASSEGEEVKGWVFAAGGSDLYFSVGQIHSTTGQYRLALQADAVQEPGEPNQEASAATALPEAGTVQGILAQPANGAEEQDWYVLTSAKSGKLTIDLDMPADISVAAELLDGNKRRVEYMAASTRGERVSKTVSVGKGTYYLVLKSVHGLESAGVGAPLNSIVRPYVITTTRP